MILVHGTCAWDLCLGRVLGIYANHLYVELVRELDVCMGHLLGTYAKDWYLGLVDETCA